MSSTKKVEEAVENTEMPEVTELMYRLNTPRAVFIGTATMQGWRPGKQITEAEYRKAVTQFIGSPAGRR